MQSPAPSPAGPVSSQSGAVMTPRVRGCARAGPSRAKGSSNAEGRAQNERSNCVHEARPACGQCASSSDEKTEAPRRWDSSVWVGATTTRVIPRSQSLACQSPPLPPIYTSGSGVGRKWAGGDCARRRWRRSRSAASRPRERAGSERSGAAVGSGAELAERALSPRHGPEHVVLAIPSGGH